jgi:glucosylceramidase
VILTAAGVAVISTTRPSGAPDPAPTRTQTASAELVTTSTDRSRFLETSTTPLQAAGDEAPDILVDPSTKTHTIRGFGAALTHSAAGLIASMPAGEQTALLTELFAVTGPVRLSALRVPVGASDFVDGEPFTFDDLPDGETDWSMDRVDIGPDRASMIPVLQQIVAIRPEITIIASPWSPPAWLKTTGRLDGGRLLDEDRAYDAYSAYLVAFLKAYRDEGIEVSLITPQNEPQLRHPDGYPGTDMPVWQQAKLVTRLGPAMQAAGLETQILGFDHNWQLNPNDAATTPEGEDPAYQYPADLMSTDAATWLQGIAFHCYYGSADAQSRLLERFPDLEIWVTECSGSFTAGDPSEKVFADTLAWQTGNVLIPSVQHGGSGVLTWNLALDPENGPHHGGCETCTGVVTIGSDGSVTRNAEYAMLAQASRFVPPGSVVVGSTANDLDGVLHVAFRAPEGRLAVIMWNGSEEQRAVVVDDGDRRFEVDLSAHSLTSATWPSEVALSD